MPLLFQPLACGLFGLAQVVGFLELVGVPLQQQYVLLHEFAEHAILLDAESAHIALLELQLSQLCQQPVALPLVPLGMGEMF